MNISRYDAQARVTAVLAVGLIAVPAALATAHDGGARPAKAPALAISVSDGQVAARPGQVLTYTASLRNMGTAAAARLVVTETLSAGLDVVRASGNGVVRASQVTWSTAVPARGTQTFRVTARVTNPPARILRLADVACVTLAGGRQPIVCAAHLDRLPAAATAGPARHRAGRDLWPYAAAILAVLAACLAAAFFSYRARVRHRPPSHGAARRKAAETSPPVAPGAHRGELSGSQPGRAGKNGQAAHNGPGATPATKSNGGGVCFNDSAMDNLTGEDSRAIHLPALGGEMNKKTLTVAATAACALAAVLGQPTYASAAVAARSAPARSDLRAATAARDPDTTVTFTVTSGALSMSAPATAALGSGAPGTTISGALGAVTVTDDRALLSATWTVTVSSSDFTTGGSTPAETIPATDVGYDPGTVTTTGTVTATSTPVTLSGTAQPVEVGTAGVGDNTASWDPTVAVAVPASAVGGTYTGTVTHSVS